MVTTKPDVAPPQLSESESRKALVQRVLRSGTFAKSERLCTFLFLVSELSLNGRAGEINEQKIGTTLFGRSPDYDSSVDGIVRTQASRLRQRLDLYFSEEGVDEPLRIILPRGSYVPVFEAKQITSGIQATVPTTSTPPAAASTLAGEIQGRPEKRSVIMKWSPWLLSLALALFLIVHLGHEHRASPRLSTGSRPSDVFWQDLFSSAQPTIVVAPDSGLVLFHGFSGQDIDLREYLDAGYRSEPAVIPQIGPTASRKDSLLDLANRRYTSMVDVRTILRLKDRAQMIGSDVSVRYARDLRPNDFKAGNAILLGSSEADPWIELYEHNMNFVFKDDYKGVYSILNRTPAKDEPSHWDSQRDDPERRVYGVVAFLPNFTGEGNTLLLEGTGMSGAEAGMDFVLDDAQLMPFLDRIRRSNGKVPHFELLLETHNIGASAVRSMIVAWRVTD